MATHLHDVRSTVCRTAVPHRRWGFTLIEMLLAVAILGILAAALLLQFASDAPQRLRAAASIVASDLDYGRDLAVANNSQYRITFEPAENRYFLQHSGANRTLDTLPVSPFRQSGEGPTRQTTNLASLPLPAPGVRLVGVVRMQSGPVFASDIEFTPLGGTTSAHETVVWLGAVGTFDTGGSGTSQRYISVHVNPVTGLTTIGPLVGALPAAVASQFQ